MPLFKNKRPEKEQQFDKYQFVEATNQLVNVIPKEIENISFDKFCELISDDKPITSTIIYRNSEYTEVKINGDKVQRFKIKQEDIPQFEKVLEDANFKRINKIENMRVWRIVK